MLDLVREPAIYMHTLSTVSHTVNLMLAVKSGILIMPGAAHFISTSFMSIKG